MTQKDFAKLLGFAHYNRISELESGKTKPSQKTEKLLTIIADNIKAIENIY